MVWLNMGDMTSSARAASKFLLSEDSVLPSMSLLDDL